jgi:hypothetical protein
MSQSKAAKQRCACGQTILSGLDADRAAFTVEVDPQHLSDSGELLAVIFGRKTYSLNIGHVLRRRDQWHLRNPSNRPVLAEHLCGEPIPERWLGQVQPKSRLTESDQEIPF